MRVGRHEMQPLDELRDERDRSDGREPLPGPPQVHAGKCRVRENDDEEVADATADLTRRKHENAELDRKENCGEEGGGDVQAMHSSIVPPDVTRP